MRCRLDGIDDGRIAQSLLQSPHLQIILRRLHAARDVYGQQEFEIDALGECQMRRGRGDEPGHQDCGPTEAPARARQRHSWAPAARRWWTETLSPRSMATRNTVRPSHGYRSLTWAPDAMSRITRSVFPASMARSRGDTPNPSGPLTSAPAVSNARMTSVFPPSTA